MQITSVHVEGLHGAWDFDLSFPTGPGMLLLHAPNGYGKTTVLRLVHALASRDWQVIARTSFRSLVVTADDGRAVRVRPQEAVRGAGGLRRLEVTWDDDRVELDVPIARAGGGAAERAWLDGLRALAPENRRQALEIQARAQQDAIELPLRLEQQLRSLRVRLIETQRLVDAVAAPGQGPDPGARIVWQSRDMARRMGRAASGHSELSARLDREFPRRLLRGALHPAELDELVALYHAQNLVQQRLVRAGLLGEEFAEDLSADIRGDRASSTRDVLSLFLEHTTEKLGAFDELLEAIELFLALVNDKLHGKRLELLPVREVRRPGGQRGAFKVTSDADGRDIPLTALSSGEQHQIVLLYDLVFSVPARALVLIDEPELSLHVAWQEQFLEDLEAVQALRGLSFLVATHSPFIVGDRDDRLVTSTPTARRATPEDDAAARAGEVDTGDEVPTDEHPEDWWLGE